VATRSLNVVIAGDARQLGAATAQADKHMKTVEAGSGRMSKALSIGFGAGVAGAGLLVAGLKQVVDAAIESEKSQARMVAQLKASGISYRAHAREIENVIQKTSRLAALDDEDLQDAFTNIVRSTGSVNTALRNMSLVADLARAKHLDVARAGDVVGKVLSGNVGVLRRYGIAFTPVTAAQDKLRESTKHASAEQVAAAKAADKTASSQAALAQLQRRFAGQAAAYGKTAAGAQERFQVATENLKEMIGAALLPTITRATNAVAKFVNQMQDGTGAGGGFARTIRNIDNVLGPLIHSLGSVISFMGRYRSVTRATVASFAPFVAGINTAKRAFDGLRSAAQGVIGTVSKVGSVFGSVAGTLKSAAGIIPGVGDGLGSLQLPSGAFSGGGSLMGANSSMAPFASIGARFGLHVSSGRRPGAITTSGNVSYHSSGEAIDEAGTPSGMMGFFNYLKNTQGPRLAELIYGPGQVGIKDGRPYNFGPALNAQHMDHVHVAYDTGRPGVGDGIGEAAQAAYSEGFRGSSLITAVAIAGAESNYRHDAKNLRYPDHSIGEWQINQLAHKGRYGSDAALTNVRTNARAAYQISGGGRNFSPWSTFTNGAYRGYLSQAQQAVRSIGSSRSKGGGGGSSISGGGNTRVRTAPLISQAGFGALPDPASSVGYAGAMAEFGYQQARAGSNPVKLEAAVSDEIRVKKLRLAKIKKALKRRLTAGTRQRLLEEATTLVGEIGDLRDLDRSLVASIKSGARHVDPSTGQVPDAGTQDTPAAADTPSVAADTTPVDTGPDQATIDAQNALTESQNALAAALQGVKDALDTQTKFATSVAQTDSGQLTKMLADIVGGYVVGRGVAGRSFTPGAGVAHAY
jgi:hypothetical protein